MLLSKDQKSKHAVKDIIKDINAMETVESVQTYIAGDDRPDVLDAARLQIELIEKTSPEGIDQLPQAPAPEVPPAAAIASDAGATPKQGEQDGPITRMIRDFKTSIQGAKSAAPESVTGSDIVEAIDNADKDLADRNAAPASEKVAGQDVMDQIDADDKKRAEDLERRAAQDERDKKAGKINPDIVTAEVVIKRMRAEGKRI
jgi:hypothetical protein